MRHLLNIGLRRVLQAALWMPVLALAHISGFTDTSIQISATGVRILYTLPSDNLIELARNRAGDTPALAPPAAYLDRVRDGWSVRSGAARCLGTQAVARALDGLPSYQFQLTYVCPHGMDELTIGYHLFVDVWPDHENFVRMFMAGQRQRMRFTAETQSFTIPVASLLSQWGKPLAVGFFDTDPNRRLQDSMAGADTGMPQVVEPPPSLGSLHLLETDPGFIELGLRHIFAGLDHVLFVLGLVLVTRSWRRLLALVTSFTAAHSVTLGLSTLGLVSIDARIAEPLIALTILYIGLENLWVLSRGEAAGADRGMWRRILLVFVFGLIHGVGFSYVLREMGLREDLLGSLVFFNLGVELGQLCIIAAALPLVLLWRRQHWGAKVSLAASAAVACAGMVMLVSRV
jgi:hydrogenase/urease accessory protein HupE